MRADRDGVAIDVLVQPRASRNKLGPVRGERLKVAVTAPPVNGAANAAIEAYLAKRLALARRSVQIVNGHSSRRKTVRISGVSTNDMRATLTALGVLR